MNRIASVTSSRRKKQRGLVLSQLFIVAGFLALVWFSFGQNVLAPREQVRVPGRFGPLELVSKVEGSETLAQVRRLHGTDVNLVTAYIAEYAHGGERVTVWVGGAESESVAAELTRRMIEGIERGGAGFGNLQRLTIAGHGIFQVEGPGGKHFFYNSKEKVVWLTVEAADAMVVVERALKTF
ncbi:MAG: hypothetical protein M1136_03270 [Chloroflexi bacterium]|nr:hypothetical protein [Chloroflexota bacterium]